MNWMHIHLLLNHVPVVGILITLPLLAWGLARRSQDVIRASLALLVVLAVATVAVFLTGEPAEDAIEHLPGVSERMIEAHEDAAKFATAAFEVLGLLALGGLIAFRRRPVPVRFGVILLLLALIPAASTAWTANLGGQIRHSEIRPDADSGFPVDGAERDEEG